ncbi:hypothetical protein [Lysinibacillus sp. Bpr_S20]|uniref:hypothetical protein n=1 Tax=Lysinibacillus sp. Bpr_S20 TaxID=2933964 RepID=UPI0020132AA5|nr:hypothetical protein [Lysinibacillus sp. Bpr_S20]MCL1701005.1 hypothetical protein [Lysinibacillus sp. Bpr_S20]
MSRFASLQGLICDANPQGVAQSPLQSTYTHDILFITMSSKTFGDELSGVNFRWKIEN